MIDQVSQLDYAKPKPPRAWSLKWIIALPSVIGLLLALGWQFRFQCYRPRPLVDSVKCQSNLRQIGQGLLLYSNENHGMFPPNLAQLIPDEEMTGEVFVCPGSNDIRATGPTTQAVLTTFSQSGHCSYVYLGAGLTERTVTSSTVLAYEIADNHSSYGRNVLLGDGSARPMPPAWFKQLEMLLQQRGSSSSAVVVAASP